MPRLGFRSASIVHASHVVAAIGAVLHRVVDALVGEDAGHEHILDADIAQEVVEIGGIEAEDEVLASTISSLAGAIAATIWASHEPAATDMPESL